jgi:hypothetical protein
VPVLARVEAILRAMWPDFDQRAHRISFNAQHPPCELEGRVRMKAFFGTAGGLYHAPGSIAHGP